MGRLICFFFDSVEFLLNFDWNKIVWNLNGNWMKIELNRIKDPSKLNKLNRRRAYIPEFTVLEFGYFLFTLRQNLKQHSTLHYKWCKLFEMSYYKKSDNAVSIVKDWSHFSNFPFCSKLKNDKTLFL